MTGWIGGLGGWMVGLWFAGLWFLLFGGLVVVSGASASGFEGDGGGFSLVSGGGLEGTGGPVVAQSRYELEFFMNPRPSSRAEGREWSRICVRTSNSMNVDRDIVVNLAYTLPEDLSNAPESITIRNGNKQACFSPTILADGIIEPPENQEITGTSPDANVTFSSSDILYRTVSMRDAAVIDSSARGEITLTPLTPELTTVCDYEKICRAPVLVEEDVQEVRFQLTMSQQATVDVRLSWQLGTGYAHFLRGNGSFRNDFAAVPPNPIVIPAHTAPNTPIEFSFRVLDDALDEDLEEITFQFFHIAASGLESASLLQSAHVFMDDWGANQYVIRIGASDLVDVAADSRVSGLAAVAGDSVGGSLDRAVMMSWSEVSDDTGVHRYVLEAVPAPPLGTSPGWDSSEVVTTSVWGRELTSGVLAGLVENSEYAVRVTPWGNRDDNVGLASGWVRVRTGSPPILGFSDGGAGFTGSEGGSVSVGVELDYGLVRTVGSGRDDPSDVRFRVVPFVGPEDSLDVSELPEPVEGKVVAGESSGLVMLEVADDMLVEGDETFSVRLEPVVAEPVVGEEPEVPRFSVGDPVGVTVTDDDEGPVTVSVSGGFRSQGVDGLVEGGTTDEQWGVFTVSLSEMLGSDLLVGWRLADGFGLGQISDVQDGAGMSMPLAGSGVVRVGVGEMSGSVSLRLADDELAEGLGELSVVFSDVRFADSRVRPGGGFPVGFLGGVSELSTSVVVEASDQDALTVPAGGLGGVVDSDGVGWVSGDRLGRDADRMVTVRWSDSEFSNPGRTGFRLKWGVFSGGQFDPAASERVVVLDPGLRVISLGGLDPGGSYRVEVTELVGSTDGSVVRFENVTTAAAISAGWLDVDGEIEITEGGSFGLGVSLSGAGRAVPADFGFVVVGEGVNDLVAADLEGEVRIAPGLVEGSLAQQIGVVDDDIVEGNETASIGMRAGSVYVPGVAFPDNYRVTVTDTDVANVSLSVAEQMVAEDRVGGVGDNNSFVVEVSLDKPVAAPVTVNLAMSGVDTADLVGGLSAQVVIPVGETSVSIPVEITDDELTEVAETVVVAISSESVNLVGRDDDPVLFSATDTVSVTIQPSDVAVPTVSAVTTTAGVDLGGVRVDTHDRIEVSWAVPTDVDGVSGYVARFTSVPAGGSAPAEGDWMFGGEVSDPAATSLTIEGYLGLEVGGSYLVEVSARVWGNSDSFDWVRSSQPVMLSAVVPVLSLSGPSGPVAEAEGAMVAITATLSAPVSFDVGFRVSARPITTEFGVDFSLLESFEVQIPAGQTSVGFELEVLNDDVVEGSESLVVGIDSGSVASGVGVNEMGNTVLVVVSDDDTALVSVSSPLGHDWVTEDIPMDGSAASIEYVFGLDNPVAVDVSVGWRIVTDSEVTSADLSDVSGTAIIPAGELEMSMEVVVTDDDVAEVAEIVVLQITSVTASVTDRSAAVTASAIDTEVTVVLAASDQPAVAADQVSNVQIIPGNQRLSVQRGWVWEPDINRLSIVWDLPSDHTDVASYKIEVAVLEENKPLSDLDWMHANSLSHQYASSPRSVSSITRGSWNELPEFVPGTEYVGRIRIVETGGDLRDWVYSEGLPARVAGPLRVSLDKAVITNTGVAGSDVVVTDGLDENGNHYSVNVFFSQSLANSTCVTVFYRVTSDNAVLGNSRDSSDDYLIFGSASGSGRFVTICGAEAQGFTVEILDDEVADGDKSIAIFLTGASSITENVVIDTSQRINIIILDDETASPLPSDVAVVAGDADGENTDRMLSVSWTPPTVPEGLDVSGYVVQYARADSVATGWSDDIVVDGVDTSELLVVPEAGLDPGPYKVRVRSVVSSREGIFGWVDSSESAMVSGVVEPVAVAFSSTEYFGVEGGSWFGTDCPTVGLSLSEVALVPVRFGLLNETGEGFSSGEVVGTVPAGSAGWEGQVCIADDDLVEDEEVVDLGLSMLSEEAVVGEVASTRLRIIDDDRSLVSLSPSTLAVVEDVVAGGGAGNEVSLEVGLSKVLSQDVVVGLAFSGDGIGSEDLSSSDVMFSGLEASVTVPAGESSVMVVVEVADDDIAEPTQILSVEMSGLSFPDGGFEEGVVSVDTDRAVVEVSIASSDDYAVGVSASLPGTNMEVAEDVDGGTESVVSYVVSLDSPVDVEVRVEFELVAASEADAFYPTDVVVTPASPLVIAVGDTSGTIEVRVVDDEFREDSEGFQIRLISVSGTPSDGTLVEIIQPLGSTVTIAASDSDSTAVEPDPDGQVNSGNGNQGGQTTQPTQPPTGGNGQTPTNSPPAGQGGQTPQPTQPPAGGNGQSQNPNTGSPTNPGSQPTGVSPTSPSGQPTGSPTSLGGQPTGGSPTNPGVQPNTGGGGVPPGGVAGPSPAGDAASGTTFIDTIGNTHESNIGMLADLGITRGCNPPSNTRYCPDRAVTRGEMATFMVRAFDLADSSENLFGDDDGNTHESNINRLATAEITRGCNPPTNSRYCPDRPVTRAQMATFLARALSLDEGSGDFTDTANSVHSNDINRIATVGITRGCNPPTNSRYCPDRPVTRAEMATFLIRATDLDS